MEQLKQEYPAVEPYLRNMPKRLESRFTVRRYPPGRIIHQKQTRLDYFGIVCGGDHRVINEFENGNVYMIEKNEPVDFIGEVTILAGMEETSVTIESLTECTVMMFSRADFEYWISVDLNFLRMVAGKVAFKLYRSSYNRGARLFYPPNFLVLDYILKHAEAARVASKGQVTIPKTRQQMSEELGMTVKTINRAVARLKEEGVISICKGKIAMSSEQYEKGKRELRNYMK